MQEAFNFAIIGAVVVSPVVGESKFARFLYWGNLVLAFIAIVAAHQ